MSSAPAAAAVVPGSASVPAVDHQSASGSPPLVGLASASSVELVPIGATMSDGLRKKSKSLSTRQRRDSPSAESPTVMLAKATDSKLDEDDEAALARAANTSPWFVKPAGIICMFALIICGIVLSVYLFNFFHEQELGQWRNNLSLLCRQRAETLNAYLGFAFAAMRGVASFGLTSVQLQYENHVVLNQTDFHSMIMTSSTPEFLDQIIWAPYVTHDRRAQWERETGVNITGNLIPGQPFTGVLPPSPDGDMYFPWQVS
jgi:hypothetical protein